MARGKNEVTLTFAGDTDKLEKSYKEVGAGAEQVGKRVGRGKEAFKKFNKVAVGASLAVGAGVAKLGVDAFKLSQQLGDLDAKSEAVFEGQLSSVQAWADKNKAAFGTSRTEVVGLAANFADLLKPMGFTTKQATKMTKETLELSGALANWSGGQFEASEVSEILSKAMLGERDQLKSLGIAISEADVQQRLAKNGADELTGAALQQAKAIATQELIMEKSTDAQSAWAEGGRESKEAQNASKVAIAELREALARGLTPAFEKGTEIVAQFSKWAADNQGKVKTLGLAVIGLAGFVLAANAAYKVYIATTKVAILVQKGLNLAMRMNPIGLVITAIAGLVAVIVMAWKKSETFKRIVTGAFNAVKRAALAVWNWIKNNWKNLAAVIFGPFGIAVRIITANWDKIKAGAKAAIRGIKSVLSGLGNAIAAPFRWAFGQIKSIWNSILGGKGFSVNLPFGLPDLNVRIPRLHTGGVVPGAPGQESMALLQAGERVTKASSQPRTVMLQSDGSAFSDLIMDTLRNAVRAQGGDVQLVLGQG